MTHSNILLVDDDPGAIQLMARILSGVGQLRFATSGEDALRLASVCTPDLVLLDAEMPGMDGFRLCKALKAIPELVDVPVIFVTSHSAAEVEVAGFELGAVDFIAKPVSAPLVLARVKTQLKLKRLTDELRRSATIDALTEVANRRRFNESLEREWQRARRSAEPISLLLLDVDHFKLFNDGYGHPAGDACLHAVAQAMVRACLRPGDLVARFGGEEFAMLLPQTLRDGAQHMALRVLDQIETLAMPHAASLTARHVTVSIGVACYDESSACWVKASDVGSDPIPNCCAEDLVQAADKALYAAKQGGRAHARLLDMAEVNTPALAHQVSAV